MSVRIIVDSTVDVNATVKERLEVVPLTVHFGAEEYVDGVTITNQEFYRKLIESDVLPSTSQATPQAFSSVFQKVTDAGESAVVLTISSQLSGTYQSAVIAAEDYPNIHVVDSNTATIGAGILAELALQLADAGMEARELAARLIQERERVCVIALLDTLEYLKRGGRISKTEAFAGTILSIKPIIGIQEGKLVTLGKARGSRQGNSFLNREIQNAGGPDVKKPVLLGYTGLSDVALRNYMEESRELWQDRELSYTGLGSVIGTHTGPGTIAVAFFKS